MESVSFYFQGEEYTALINYRHTAPGISPSICVTIMNGELETKFFGFHQFTYINGKIEPQRSSTESLVQELQKIIIDALQQQIDKVELAG